MTHLIPLSALERAAKIRPAGWLATVKAAGTLRGPQLELTPDAYQRLVADYGALTGLRGLGDVVALGAKPMARAVDRVFGTDLAHCGACQERQRRWNAAVPL